MTDRALIQRYLDPGEALGEVLFGLIMALSFTVGARLLVTEEEFDATELVVAAVGCNIAWGVIDAVLFVLGSLFHRSQRAVLSHAEERPQRDGSPGHRPGGVRAGGRTARHPPRGSRPPL